MSQELEEEAVGSELEDPNCEATGWELPRGDTERKKGLQPGPRLMLTGCMTFSKKLLLWASVYSSASSILFPEMLGGWNEKSCVQGPCELSSLVPVGEQEICVDGKSQESSLEHCEWS